MYVLLVNPEGRQIRVMPSSVAMYLRKGCTPASKSDIPDDGDPATHVGTVADAAGEPPAESDLKADWVTFASRVGIDNPDEFAKEELIDKVGS